MFLSKEHVKICKEFILKIEKYDKYKPLTMKNLIRKCIKKHSVKTIVQYSSLHSHFT
jgi:hypothetical protein